MGQPEGCRMNLVPPRLNLTDADFATSGGPGLEVLRDLDSPLLSEALNFSTSQRLTVPTQKVKRPTTSKPRTLNPDPRRPLLFSASGVVRMAQFSS